MPDTIHPSWLTRKIIHLDMDAFYASVEMRENPSLRDVPLAIGGSPKGRGVVATANYVARRYGIRSAMAMAHAVKLCPDLVIVRPRFALYKEVSRAIHAIMLRYTPLVEMSSLDEAALDVTDVLAGGRATAIAQSLQQAIARETQLTASLGVAPNKMLAKILADLRKPNGISVMVPEQVAAFMQTMPVARLPGVGKVTASKLEAFGIHFCGDVGKYGDEALAERFGNRFASWLSRRAQGIDERGVELSRERKSLGKERTFSTDSADKDFLQQSLTDLCREAHSLLVSKQFLANGLTVKIKFADFRRTSRSVSLPFPNHDASIIRRTALHAFQETWDSTDAIRLLGVTFHGLTAYAPGHQTMRWRQRELFEEEGEAGG